jgi:hypothetical protein
VKTTNHNVMVLKCPQNADECRIKIFSTGSGTETVARNARKRIRRCPHGSFEDQFDGVEHLLEDAERLLSAAATELERRDREVEAEALLQIADDPLAGAAEMLDAFTRYGAVADAEAELRSRRAELLGADEVDMAPDQLVGAAASGIRQADQNLRDLPAAHDRYTALSQRLAEAQRQREHLRDVCSRAS